MPITYKCPNCGAAMEFDSTAQKLKCPSCQMEMDVQDYEKQYGHLYSDAEAGENAQSAQSEGQKGKGSMNMKVYHCQSCGAELLADEYTSATICSFCGNPSLVEDRLSGEFSPSSVIPFQIDREAAKKMYKSWVKKGLLTPKTLSTESTIEKISISFIHPPHAVRSFSLFSEAAGIPPPAADILSQALPKRCPPASCGFGVQILPGR